MNPFKYLFGKRFLDQRVSPIGLSLFRIAAAIVLLWEVGEMFYYRHLIFDYIPFIKPSEFNPTPILVLWLIALVGLLVGWKTRTAATINFCCSLFTFATFREFEYHFDHVAHCICSLLMFVPVSEMFSVDAWLKKRSSLTAGTSAPVEERGVHPIYYNYIMLVAIGLLYLDSAAWKMSQSAWQEGLGVWRPMSCPPFTWFPTASLQGLLNQKWLMITANFATLFLEIAFILMMWSRFCRIWIILPVGLALHGGIGLAFPLPKFAAVMLALYVVVLPPDIWERVYAFMRERVLRLKHATLSVKNYSFDAVTQKSAKLNRPGIVYAVAVYMVALTVFQFILMLSTPFFGRNKILNDTVRLSISKAAGVCSHGVFLDYHWTKYDHVVAVAEVHKDGSYEWLPFTTKEGYMGSYATDRMWARWGFRANGPTIADKRLETAIQNMTAFWLQQNDRTLKDVKFVILAQAMHPNLEWCEDQLTKHMNTPWQIVGEAKWTDKEFEAKIANIEQVAPLDVNAKQVDLASQIKTMR
jgi:hypothetical protein